MLPASTANEGARQVLLDLLACDEVDEAPALIAPHLTDLLQCDLGLVSRRLESEISSAGEYDVEDVRAVTDFAVSFLEQVVTQATEIRQSHEELLKEITFAAKESDAALDQALLRRRGDLDATFVAFVDSEVNKLDELPLHERNHESDKLARFLTAVGKRVKAELEAIDSTDGANIAALLGLATAEQQVDSVEAMLGENNIEGILRFENMVLTSLGDLRARAEKGIASEVDPALEGKMLGLLVVFEDMLERAKEAR